MLSEGAIPSTGFRVYTRHKQKTIIQEGGEIYGVGY